MRIFNRRSNNGSSGTEPGAIIQSGWAAFTFSGTATNASFTITFPKAFAGVPIVVLSFGGDQASGSPALGSGGNTVKLFAAAKVTDVTSSNCKAWVYTTDNTTYVSGQVVYVHWIAIGA